MFSSFYIDSGESTGVVCFIALCSLEPIIVACTNQTFLMSSLDKMDCSSSYGKSSKNHSIKFAVALKYHIPILSLHHYLHRGHSANVTYFYPGIKWNMDDFYSVVSVRNHMCRIARMLCVLFLLLFCFWSSERIQMCSLLSPRVSILEFT